MQRLPMRRNRILPFAARCDADLAGGGAALLPARLKAKGLMDRKTALPGRVQSYTTPP